ncbi:uncharacterized protein LAESUDRAFT_642177 [Laetiporus sulphureus 93-53]|uniref:FYVE-type domain-containing protein n=1 Tax=Laetiporus sulphureus 93-53 TaxID=1314785 RepID=A0A165H6H7_9APHY|nr:uncharacterized protein LAESUDRAFT_642177 [Laetiporus sulphureus 93-53]KZT11310.1 hypothetical protein LAESUDRAFT_642177 [Laetiporus sulphureus 93-53]
MNSSPVSVTSLPSPKVPYVASNANSMNPPSPVAGPSTLSAAAASDRPGASSRRMSTFRHLRPSSARSTLSSSPLRPTDTHVRTSSSTSSLSRPLELLSTSNTPSQASSVAPSPSIRPYDRDLPALPTLDTSSRSASSHAESPQLASSPVSPSSAASFTRVPSSRSSPQPRNRTLSPAPAPYATYTPASSHAHTPSIAASPSLTVSTRTTHRALAPYRPGFQPKGLYRPRTDEFVEARAAFRNVGRIERTRLERRLEKLINLHFPPEEQKAKEKAARPGDRLQAPKKRPSSIFDMDFSELRAKSATDLWRDVVQSQMTPAGKNDIRAAEQTITPWEEDASVSQCPLCSATFHPITNRKHHCRLCGRIICSLPVKYPQRPQPCSLLFVADPKTGRIEEVGEGVDYGVRRRTTSYSQLKGGRIDEALTEEEKFLKGVRICRECRPVLLRQQHKYEVQNTPIFFKLYDTFISVEKEIEDALPQFQELMLSLRLAPKQERPAPEASAVRKRLLEAFGQYDVLAKRIRQLRCPPGSSQDRLQSAILNRANLFLQKHMFPLQSLPKPSDNAKASPPAGSESEERVIDPDSEVARVLQPLLEQEALLDSFIEEAQAHRKFEDAKTLKVNLQEIRAEINRILTNAEAGMGEQTAQGKSKKKGV